MIYWGIFGSVPGLFFADILVPDFGVLGDVAFEEFAAFAAVQIDDFDAVFAQPVQSAGEGAALADDERADAKLPHQSAAIPAGREGGDHDQVAIAFLSPGTAKSVGFAVHAGVALLHAAIVAPAEQIAGSGKECRADGDSPFGQPGACFLKGDFQHSRIEC